LVGPCLKKISEVKGVLWNLGRREKSKAEQEEAKKEGEICRMTRRGRGGKALGQSRGCHRRREKKNRTRSKYERKKTNAKKKKKKSHDSDTKHRPTERKIKNLLRRKDLTKEQGERIKAKRNDSTKGEGKKSTYRPQRKGGALVLARGPLYLDFL